VNSVLKQDYPDFEIIVVDNGSSDDSFSYLQRTYISEPRVEVCRLNNNLGFAGGHNFAFKKLSQASKYCIFLNDDTLVEKDWLAELIKPFYNHTAIGATASFEIKNGKRLYCWGKEAMTTNLIGLNTFYKANYKANVIDTFMVNGGSFAIRKDLVDIPFDADFFAYGEDLYLSWTLQLRGYRIAFVRKSVFHHSRSSSRKLSPCLDKKLTYYAERNRLLNLLLFYETKTLLKVFPLVLIGMAASAFLQPPRALTRFKSYLWLLTHIKKIKTQRRYIQSSRKVSDREILAKISYQNNYDMVRIPRALRSILNLSFRWYCLLFAIRTREWY